MVSIGWRGQSRKTSTRPAVDSSGNDLELVLEPAHAGHALARRFDVLELERLAGRDGHELARRRRHVRLPFHFDPDRGDYTAGERLERNLRGRWAREARHHEQPHER